jgi:hypothetical protein
MATVVKKVFKELVATQASWEKSDPVVVEKLGHKVHKVSKVPRVTRVLQDLVPVDLLV